MSDIHNTPTPSQERLLAAVEAFMSPRHHGRFLTVTGSAGSGKTTGIAMIRQLFPSAIIAAPTNKAVSVLRTKGFSQATTLDKALKHSVYVEERRPPTDAEIAFYMAEKMPIPEYITVETYEKVDRTDGQPVLVVDEASMTNIDDFELAIGNYEKVIFVGDPFQLPPVSGEAWFQTCDPSVHLNEIVRTAADSEITFSQRCYVNKIPLGKNIRGNAK